MSPSCTPPQLTPPAAPRRAFSNSYNLLLCALPCPACTPGRKKKTWLGSLIATVPQPPFPPYALNFPFFSFPYVFLFFFSSSLFFSWPVRRDSPTTWCEKFCHVQHQQKRMKGRVPQKYIQNLWLNHVYGITLGDSSTLYSLYWQWLNKWSIFLVPTQIFYVIVWTSLKSDVFSKQNLFFSKSFLIWHTLTWIRKVQLATHFKLWIPLLSSRYVK